jgi:serine/threonine protein kinase/Flp pilus assembly protein TadD
MDPHRWQRLKSILADALEEESPAARTALVERSCADDTALLREAESLLAGTEVLLRNAADDLEECADNAAARSSQEDVSEIGKRVGAYVIVRGIGQGGMGTVYLGARADGYFQKQVAIKLLKRGTNSEEVLRRFRSEREVLACLDHPNIARLIDAGTTDDGLPYFVMEYIEGIPVTRFIDENQAPLIARLNLFLKISGAVEAAHRNSIVHRDLKPTNILVNREGEPKLLDFGIAKLIGNEPNALEQTALGQERLTPVSASPEQAQGEPVTISTDIYALGVVLYEMLTGARPHRFSTTDPSREELVHVICDQLPTLPSVAVRDRERQRLLRGDLDAILLRALEKEPTRRYSSAAEFAEDIRRHLAGEPVHARRDKPTYRIKSFFLQNRSIQFSVAAVGAALLALGAILFSSLLRSDFKSKDLQEVPSAWQHSAGQSIPEKSIAVLPFDNFSADEENSYLVDGFQNDILTDLAKVTDLKVISRNSVAAFRGRAKKAREIGHVLGVSYVLEGSVQKSGDRIRVNAQLINARTEAEVWAEQYDRKVDDLFILQSELAQAIVSQLKATLLADEKAEIETRPTTDMLAYDLYLRARESFFQSNYRKTIQLLETAIGRDPRFALAYCLMAEAHLYTYRFMGDMTPDRLAKAKGAAEMALRLAPNLAESHLAKAQYYYYGLRDYEEARRELTVTTPSLTGRAKFIDLAALTERRLGHWRDAIRDGEKAAELDPDDPFTANELVESYIAVRRFVQAEQTADKAIKLIAPQNGYLWRLKSESLLGRGRIEEARAVLEHAPFDTSRIYGLAKAAMFARDFTNAARLLANVPPPEGGNYDIPFLDGILARAQGDSARARSSFEVARAGLAAKLLAQPNDAELLSNLALTDAGLGRKEDALREGRQAIQLVPVSRDAVDGPVYVTALAKVYVWSGEHDAALGQLAAIVKLPQGPSYGELRFDPAWDEIRTKPRFEKILSEAAEAPVIE